ncbi:MAG: 3'(2'),5'-bisphosphate nucleotidase CysQ [Rhodobacter sp.]|uniref:inositol monophosphatase family protein n=1 Tax=Pararhodobacter sp. TaxID=2127056 RepID=UPI001D69A919|nr:3'(2'),5'-bisphosphate nucleotidase CysQ [Pararhodobacter sp.]MCB1344652.1 3'(2'),5'-bisphosphate nucleotidase CysQ [Paracoccaceae bacterium]MCC0071864.1 3'(2'),5'-bisphosphate nucleotidase CysQ [Rhodobacter sp.]HPD92591.1 3'(2'),5'-bisphosphate nucleotidase CysQ [Pararhodobacter sp.]
MPGPDTDLALLLDAARGAGEIAQRHFRAGGRVWDKGGGQGPVTEADLAVNDYLQSRLCAARPGYGWLSEESDPLGDLARLQADTLFVVDPIDGTRAFIEGQNGFAHALAVVRAGQPVAAVVHLPMMGLTYAARQGGGAQLNGAPITVTGHRDAAGARVLATRPAMDPQHWPGGVPAFERHFRPSLAWRLALVAEGRFDAMLTLRDAWDWDIAGAALIVAEAGGVVTDRAGAPLRFNTAQARSPGVVAAGPALQATLLERLTAPGPAPLPPPDLRRAPR